MFLTSIAGMYKTYCTAACIICVCTCDNQLPTSVSRYDTGFVMSEVNSDIKMHVQKPGGEFRPTRCNTRKSGKVMMTKAVGSAEGVDVMANYKHTEGTVAERVTLESGGAEQDDVTVDIVVFENVMIGQDLKAKLVLTSSATAERTVDFIVRVQPVTYVGFLGNTMATIEERRTLVHGSELLLYILYVRM